MFYEIRKGKTRRREESFSFSNEGGSRGGMASRRMDDLPLLAAPKMPGSCDVGDEKKEYYSLRD